VALRIGSPIDRQRATGRLSAQGRGFEARIGIDFSWMTSPNVVEDNCRHKRILAAHLASLPSALYISMGHDSQTQ